eukprot:TRINITY_DN9390_c0_g2_i6.p1 TRINITY_DN9390_c0_g2~~TRINITY_DN9390_c0_g2_i6.p1  ORF type:complete len:404 (+),score=94.64 TRINITY_DN9390_c0_g2_i6:111-1322(+)
MERYAVQKKVGNGTYGTVFKAIDRQTGRVVAIKHMKRKFGSWEECLKLRELQSLRKLSSPNIIKLKQVVRVNEELFFVFEYMEHNLRQLVKHSAGSLDESRIRMLMFQALNGLKHAHESGFFHRDLKPENLLVQGDLLKIADFGLARRIHSQEPFTEYVSTRWYRAPEILLRCKSYSAPVDIFALGTIMAELYTHKPLFPGINERDQLIKECEVLGTPSYKDWPEGHKLAAKAGFEFPQLKKLLREKVAKASDEAINLMLSMMSFNPTKRLTASQCMAHPYFSPLLPGSSTVQRGDNARNKSQSVMKVRKNAREGVKVTSIAPVQIAQREYNSSNLSQYRYKDIEEEATKKLLAKIKARINFSKNNHNLPVITKKKILAIINRKSSSASVSYTHLTLPTICSV